MEMNFDELRQKLNNITLQGRNLGNVEEASFNLLSDFDFAKYEIEVGNKEKDALVKLQQKYQDLYSTLERDNSVKPMEYDEEGKVIIKPGVPFHRAVQKIDVLRNISAGGILASEWFGELESECEGCFCSFLNTTNDPGTTEDYFQKSHNEKMGLSRGTFADCVLYFDGENPVMKDLMSMDFFEYAHLKKTTPEKISEIYSKDIIELFETLISPLSVCGKTMHDSPNSESIYWMAIPGGIPPQLINGICINSKNLEMNANVSLLMDLFPNATIFDESRKVLNRERENEELIKLDEINLNDKLQEMSLGEVSSFKNTMDNQLGKAKDLLEVARAHAKNKAPEKRRDRDGRQQ